MEIPDDCFSKCRISSNRTRCSRLWSLRVSEVPKEPEKSTFLDLVYDLAAIFDSLAISKGFVIGKDFGALTAYQFAILHPGRVKGVVTCGAPYLPPDEFGKSISQLPEGFYMSRWREPGRAEADFARFQVKTVVRKIYVLFSKSELPIAEADKEVLDLVDECDPLPSWFTEQDLSAYADLYKRSGFRTGLQVTYRSGGSVKFPVTNPTIRSPALLIMGEKDFFLQLPGIEGQIRSGAVKKHVPNLEVKFLPQGSHFVQEQFPDKVNQLITAFLRKHM